MQADHYWDAGDLACGEVLVKLFTLFRNDIQPGETLHLVSTNEAITIDITAWCGLTGNTLLESAAPDFLIRKQGE